ncbi:hypothetical protein IGI37_000570 [Enterococcus sp. AZ194]|uniref:hypothetical protein n=1 Tax=Enterococcus sp. AZ194 TaxID=2774629 RepID=UPI003F28C86F
MKKIMKTATMVIGMTILLLVQAVTVNANEMSPSNIKEYSELKDSIIGNENVEIEQTIAKNGMVGINITRYFPMNDIDHGSLNNVGTSYAVTLSLGNVSKGEYMSKGFGSFEGGNVVDYGGVVTKIDWTSDTWSGLTLYGMTKIYARAITAPNCGLNSQAEFAVAQLGFNPNTGFNTFQESWAFTIKAGEWSSSYVGLDSDFDLLVSDQSGGLLEGKTTCTFTKAGNKQSCIAVAKKF